MFVIEDCDVEEHVYFSDSSNQHLETDQNYIDGVWTLFSFLADQVLVRWKTCTSPQIIYTVHFMSKLACIGPRWYAVRTKWDTKVREVLKCQILDSGWKWVPQRTLTHNRVLWTGDICICKKARKEELFWIEA